MENNNTTIEVSREEEQQKREIKKAVNEAKKMMEENLNLKRMGTLDHVVEKIFIIDGGIE
ncbi:MAG: hypothetical protein HQL69_19315 [Magnetococcales bacterium]|nr:hypothetical protein [Magnetococcales bacterium]